MQVLVWDIKAVYYHNWLFILFTHMILSFKEKKFVWAICRNWTKSNRIDYTPRFSIAFSLRKCLWNGHKFSKFIAVQYLNSFWISLVPHRTGIFNILFISSSFHIAFGMEIVTQIIYLDLFYCISAIRFEVVQIL